MVLAEDLRQAVLQAAIQGELTERSSADTDIQNTLLEISSKRINLDIDRKLLVSKEIDLGEVPFELPKTWTWIRLGSICEVITKGSSPKWQGINYTENGLLFITSENVGVEKLLLSERKYVDEKFDKISPRSSLKYGDLLTNIVGASIGRTALYNLEERANINQAVCIIRLINIEFAPYILKYMNSNTAYKIMMEDKVETARPNISLSNISDFLIPLPPIEEQQRIVKKVNEIMIRINEYEKIEKELEALKREFPTDMKDALLQAAMQGKLTAQLESDSSVDELLAATKLAKEEMIAQKKIKKEKPLPDIEEEERPFDIPENWRWVRMGNIIKLTSGQDLQPDKYSENNIGIPYLTGASNFQAGDLVINRYTSCGTSIAYNGDLLLTCKGTIGEMAFMNIKEAHIARQIMSISAMNDINLKYIKICLDNFILKLKANARSIIPGIDRKVILNLPIPLPSIEEQQRIVERLDALLPLCEDLKE